MTQKNYSISPKIGFSSKAGNPSRFKRDLESFLTGKHGLLNAPTGSGKTYALWFPIVLNYINQNPDYKKTNIKKA
ncbi:hypothetical protein Q2T40_20890 [Winogradskyella maritima]|nr:hypothetical protein [Winogradskyella maritima]